ncbi:hypothetical protein F5890DRAFT_1539769 [Lentinula detonsa]|uniref:Uncharacterized protein n=1 Tax=Lentinula detonsa TaxID=2804962 RepID=A0AA38PS05_9AGAR|nr:hypothetical protein F5890DRAFT_1539769 [Lentinula detonsa]
MDKSPVLERIVEWAEANGEKIQDAYNQKGGWEGWTQVELAFYLKRAFESERYGVVTVTREDNVYQGNNQRSDLLITTRKGAEHFTNMLELKCESIANTNNFKTQAKADCTKVNQGVINQNYLPCKAWVVALSVTKDLGDVQVGSLKLAAYSKRIQAGTLQLTLWWAAKSFQ